jgi:hypothetical protein
MQYIFLLYAQEEGYGTLTDAEKAAWWEKINAYNDSLVKGGNYKFTSGLQSPRTAKKLSKRGGKITMVDGPFAETKEQLLGFYLIEANDEAEALALAGKAPMVEFGTIEVRALNTRGG